MLQRRHRSPQLRKGSHYMLQHRHRAPQLRQRPRAKVSELVSIFRDSLSFGEASGICHDFGGFVVHNKWCSEFVMATICYYYWMNFNNLLLYYHALKYQVHVLEWLRLNNAVRNDGSDNEICEWKLMVEGLRHRRLIPKQSHFFYRGRFSNMFLC